MDELTPTTSEISGDALPITMRSRLYHGDLLSAARKMGSQTALAKHLGVSVAVLGSWVRLKQCPPTCADEIVHPHKWDAAKIRNIECKLLALTGKTLDALFPVELRRNKEFLKAPKTAEETREIETCALFYDVAFRERMTVESPERSAELTDLQGSIDDVLATLPERSRNIIRLRFGLDGNPPLTLDEVGKIYGIHRETVRMIESQAIRKMQQPQRSAMLAGHLD